MGWPRWLVSGVLVLLSWGAPSVRAADEPQHFTFRDFSFNTSHEWERLEDPQAANASAQLIIRRAVTLHDERILVSDGFGPPSLTQAELASVYFADQKKKAPPEGGKLDPPVAGSRTINGVAYPTLSLHFVPDAGSPIVDTVLLVYFPADYEQRLRWYLVQWTDFHSARAEPEGLEPVDAVVSSATLRPLGTVLISEDFQNPDVGLLPNTTTEPDHYARGYVDGEYMEQKVDPGWPRAVYAQITNTFDDTTVAVDIRFESDSPGQQARVFCRYTLNNSAGIETGYLLDLFGDGRFRLRRADGPSTFVTLVGTRPSDAILSGAETNHVELTCAGNRISVSINGTPLGLVYDAKYREGRIALGASATDATVDVRFQNLVVSQQ